MFTLDFTCNNKLLPLFPVQKDLLNIISPPHHWNISYMIFIDHTCESQILKNIIHEISRYHEIFLFRFINKNGFFYQYADESSKNNYLFEEIVIKDESSVEQSIHSEMLKAQKKINVFNGPIFVVQLYKTSLGDHIYFIVNHLFVDGISLKILIDDILLAYSSCLRGEGIIFQQKTGSYIDILEQFNSYSESTQLKSEIDHWKEIIYADDGSLPKDYIIKNKDRIERNMNSTGNYFLSTKEYSELKQVLRFFRCSRFNFFLTILAIILAEWKKDNSIRIHTTNHGRNLKTNNINISRVMGPFWFTYPILLKPNRDNAISEHNLLTELRKTETIINEIPNKGRGYEILKEITLENKDFQQKANSLKDAVLFNFVGFLNEFTSRPSVQGISASPFFHDFNRSDDVTCPYSMIFNLRHIKNNLHLQIIYNEMEFKTENISRLFFLLREATKKAITVLKHNKKTTGIKS